jgi:hypothetical protein
MIKCVGSNVYICIKCKRYDPKALKRLCSHVWKEDDCRFFKTKNKVGDLKK